jgi:hypothetical protein
MTGIPIVEEFKVCAMDAAPPTTKEREQNAGGLYHANQVAAFEYSERQDSFAGRIMSCVSRAFDAIGASSQTQEIIFWKLHETQNLERKEIIDRPAEFIEGLKSVYGEAGVVVFEYMATREIKREFGIAAVFEKEPIKAEGLVDLLRLVSNSAVGSQTNLHSE